MNCYRSGPAAQQEHGHGCARELIRITAQQTTRRVAKLLRLGVECLPLPVSQLHTHVRQTRDGGPRLVGNLPAPGPDAVDDAGGQDGDDGHGGDDGAFHEILSSLFVPRLRPGTTTTRSLVPAPN